MVLRQKRDVTTLTWAYLLLVCGLFLATAVKAQAQSGTGQPGEPDQPLRVATKPLEPFVFVGGSEPSGFSIDLWEEVAERLGMSYEWLTYDTVGEILLAVEDGDADVAIAGISMTRDREALLDFTHPYFDAGLQILAMPESGFSFRSLSQHILSPNLLVFLALGLLAALIMAHIIMFIERRDDPDFPTGYLAGLWESVWYLLAMVANGEHPDKFTRNPIRRLVVIAFWLIGLLLVAQFTATVTSSLTVQSLNASIQGPDDLPGKHIATVRGSTAAEYLTERGISFLGVDLIDDAYPLLISGAVDAIVYDSPVLRYYSVTRGKGVVEVVGVIFKPEKYGIALAQGSPLREPINEILLEMYQDGSLEVIYNRWFGG